MESKLIVGAEVPPWDESLMRAFARNSAPSNSKNCLTIGIEDPAGQVYRLVKTCGVYETTRLFESARELGFGIAQGRVHGPQLLHRVLRRVN